MPGSRVRVPPFPLIKSESCETPSNTPFPHFDGLFAGLRGERNRPVSGCTQLGPQRAAAQLFAAHGVFKADSEQTPIFKGEDYTESRVLYARQRRQPATGRRPRHKRTVVSIVALRVIELPVCGRDCPVGYCWLARAMASTPRGSDGFGGLDGNTHRHDSGVSPASVQSEPAGEYHRRCLFLTLVNGFLTFVAPLVFTGARTPAYPEYVFFATIETVATSVIVWKAWTWSRVEGSIQAYRWRQSA
jgi:hypothetical protein